MKETRPDDVDHVDSNANTGFVKLCICGAKHLWITTQITARHPCTSFENLVWIRRGTDLIFPYHCQTTVNHLVVLAASGKGDKLEKWYNHTPWHFLPSSFESQILPQPTKNFPVADCPVFVSAVFLNQGSRNLGFIVIILWQNEHGIWCFIIYYTFDFGIISLSDIQVRLVMLMAEREGGGRWELERREIYARFVTFMAQTFSMNFEIPNE